MVSKKMDRKIHKGNERNEKIIANGVQNEVCVKAVTFITALVCVLCNNICSKSIPTLYPHCMWF